ncbi:MAG TPA: pirin family protein [Chitinophagaceae bacterium]|nr:pirin family protein [Chitinophagaceae bacterium]
MKQRSLAQVILAPEVMMGTIKLRQPIPVQGMEQVSPFILLHHFDKLFEPGQVHFAVPPHPHCGFCPVTYLFEGGIEHQDSLGNISQIKGDEVQWIFAGKGIVHSEQASPAFRASGGRLQGIQLWINVKAADKKLAPQYIAMDASNRVELQEEGVRCIIVSGEINGVKGAIASSVNTAMLHLQSDAIFTTQFEASHHVCYYILEGSITCNEQEYQAHQLLVWQPEEGGIQIQANESCKMLVLSGEPIHEPLVTYGPFVLNAEAEIRQALIDYNQGLMGHLEDTTLG